jgi:hypothetical protein
MRSIRKLSHVALAGAVLIGIAVTRAWANDEFVGSSSQSSGFDTSNVPNAGASQTYTAPDGSFTVNFPDVPAEVPTTESMWNQQALRTQQVVATTSDGVTSRVRYADIGVRDSTLTLEEFYKALCRSMGPHASDSDDVVAGEPAMRCQIDEGSYIIDHELLLHGERVYDISSKYSNDDLSAADTHDAFVASFEVK